MGNRHELRARLGKNDLKTGGKFQISSFKKLKYYIFILSVGHFMNYAMAFISQMAEQKRAEKGGFDNRIYNAFVELEASNPALAYYRARPDQYPEVK
ncbi:MAG: hypothetical protein ACRCYZ_00010 [Alphaproteobacteria bacterium]